LDSTKRRLAFIGLICVITALIFSLKPPAEYLPEGEEQKVFTMLFPPPGYNLPEMHTVYRKLEAEFLPYIGQDPALYARGESEMPGLNFVMGYSGADRSMILPEATSPAQVDDLVRIVSEKISDLPGIRAFASRGSIFSSNFGGTRSINLEIAGTDLVTLFGTANRAFAMAQQVFDNPQIRPTPSSLSLGQPMIEVHPDWERASELGIEADELGYAVWAYSDGAFLDEFFLGDDKIDMYVYSTQGTIQQPGDVDNIMLYSPLGGIVPLSAIADVRESVNTETIRRVDGARTITLGIVPPKNIPLEVGVQMVQTQIMDKLMAEQEIAAAINMSITGANERLIATRNSLSANFLVAVLISYLLLVASFSHWGYPFLIMTSVPVGIAGGIFGLWLLNFFGGFLSLLGFNDIHQPFDVITMLGFLILIGTVVNNPILIVDRAVKNIRRQGMQVKEAVLESTRTRLRPVMISSITTIFGLSPLVFYPGAGTELYRGLGAIVLFGLLFSTLVTLTFMPCLLSLVLEFTGRKSQSAPIHVIPEKSV
ncbi:MAG: efflux RND transporter permease subunit, partial [Gammaproteobacteria bacterium]